MMPPGGAGGGRWDRCMGEAIWSPLPRKRRSLHWLCEMSVAGAPRTEGEGEGTARKWEEEELSRIVCVCDWSMCVCVIVWLTLCKGIYIFMEVWRIGFEPCSTLKVCNALLKKNFIYKKINSVSGCQVGPVGRRHKFWVQVKTCGEVHLFGRSWL